MTGVAASTHELSTAKQPWCPTSPTPQHTPVPAQGWTPHHSHLHPAHGHGSAWETQRSCSGCSYSLPIQDGCPRLNPQPSAAAHRGALRLQHWVCWAVPAGLGNNEREKKDSGLSSSRCLHLRPTEEEGFCTSERKDLDAWVWFPLRFRVQMRNVGLSHPRPFSRGTVFSATESS